MISSSRVVIATASAATTTTRTVSSLAAASALLSSTRLHLPRSATTTTSTHHHRRHCSIGGHYGKDIVLDLRSNILFHQSCDMSQSSITPSISTAISSSAMTDIEDIHRRAMMNRRTTYIDPVTNFTVFTELAHLKRGVCCGNICRHCPYGHVNVRNRPIIVNDDTTGRRKIPKAASGDQAMTSRLVQRIMNGTYYDENEEEGESDEAEGAITNNLYSSSTIADANTSSNTQSIAATRNRQSTNTSTITKAVVGSGKGGNEGGTFTNKNVPYTRKGDTGTAQLFTGECRKKDDALFEALGTVDELCSIVGLVHAHLTTAATTTTTATQAQAQEAESNSSNNKYGELPNQLLDVMSRLFDVGSHIAKPTPQRRRRRQQQQSNRQGESNHNATTTTTTSDKNSNYSGYDFIHSTTTLEGWIDNMTNELPELLSFIIPTGSIVSAQLHVARTVCRRAERCMVPLVIDAAKSHHHHSDNKVDDDDDDDDDDDNKEVERTIDPAALAYVNRLSDYFFTAARFVNYCDGIDEVQYRAIGEERRSVESTTTTHRERVVVKLNKK